MALRVAYNITSDWGSGFNAGITIFGGGQRLDGWTLTFDAAFAITQIWNAEIVSKVGTRYTIKNAAWNGVVPADGSVSFGFLGGPAADKTPDDYAINGTPVDDGTGEPPPPPAALTLAVADAQLVEGNSGTKNMVFTVTLSRAATAAVSVGFATQPGTAVAGSDYTGKSGTLTFAAGETSKTVIVKIKGDTLVEADETMTLLLRNPTGGATISDATGIGTIRNDDGSTPPPPPPTISIADKSVTEGNSGTVNAVFTVTLSKAATSAVSVAFTTESGSAAAGADFNATSGTLTFAAGETSKTITVAVRGDTVDEPNESFSVKLSAPNGATLADATAVGTITDDDVATPPPGGQLGEGFFSTRGNQIIDASGDVVRITGVNWFGLETGTYAPHGLWARNWQDMMDQMADLGFNTIRLPFSNQLFDAGSTPNGIDLAKNPDLAGLTGLQIMDKVVDYAGQIGLKIILDNHRSAAGGGPNGNGLWYDSGYSETRWINDWKMLAQRYAGDPTVIGADLSNEPHNGQWGGGGANDWTAAAERAGNAIHGVNDDWLVFVEGVGGYQNDFYWWGGQLEGVRDDPVRLNTANKLVYSAHDYGNSVYGQPWFYDQAFPNNLPAEFDEHWGYIYREGIAPVLLGEFGTKLQDPKDTPWLDKLLAYIGGDFDANGTSDIPANQEGISWTWWSWNPNSGDTGGILQDDWTTPIQAKLNKLEPQLFDFG